MQDDLASLTGKLQKRPRPSIARGLRSVEEQLKLTTMADGNTRVQFPEAFRNLVLIVGKVEGRWYLVRFPG